MPSLWGYVYRCFTPTHSTDFFGIDPPLLSTIQVDVKRWDPMAEPDVPVERVATQMTSDYIRYILCRGLQKMKEIYPIRDPDGGVRGYQNDFAMYSVFPFRNASWEKLYDRTIFPTVAVAGRPLLTLFRAIALTVPQEISPGYHMPGGAQAGSRPIACDPQPTEAVGFFGVAHPNKSDQLGEINVKVEAVRGEGGPGTRIGEKPERIDITNHGRKVIWDGLQNRDGGAQWFEDDIGLPLPGTPRGARDSDEALDFLLFVEAGFMMNVDFRVDNWFEVAAPAVGPLGGETTDGQNLSDLLQTAKREVAAAALSPEFGRQVARGKYISNRLSQRNELPFGRVLQVGVDELRIQLMPELGADLPATDAAA